MDGPACKLSPYRQASAKSTSAKRYRNNDIGVQHFERSGGKMVGGTGIEPVTPTMST